MDNYFLDTITNKDRLQHHLVFSAIFIMVYEHFLSSWKEELKWFYANGATVENNEAVPFFAKVKSCINGNIEWEHDTDAENEFNNQVFRTVKNSKNGYNKSLSLFNWLKTYQMINESDYDLLGEIMEKRNEYVHKFYETLTTPITERDEHLLQELVRIMKESKIQWIKDIEIPTDPDFCENCLDENGEFHMPDEIYPVQNIVLECILSTALNNDIDEQ